MPLSRYLLTALVGCALAACAPQPPPPTPTPTPTAAAATPVRIAATPTLAASLPAPKLIESETGQLQALGMIENRAAIAVSDLELVIEFTTGADGSGVHRTRAGALLPHLAPGQRSPFLVPFRGMGSPTAARAEVLRYTEWTGETADITLDLSRALPTAEGGTRVLGYVDGLRDSAVRIDGFEVAAVGGDGLPFSLAGAVTAPGYLRPDERIPFQADLPVRIPLSSATAYASASETGALQAPELEVNLTPGWQLDPQGRPFLLGVVRNTGERRRSGRILLSFHRGRALLGVSALDTPIPLSPGELRPFAVADPPLLREADLNEVRTEAHVQPYIDPAPAAAPVSLRVQITAVETLGSRVFLRGVVSNPEPGAVGTPTLFAALRATDGTLWSAAWHPLGPELPSGESREFVLPLPRPQGAEVPLGEFDLRALGTASP